MKKAQFTMNDIDGEFDGYTCGNTWNSFACPFFTNEQAVHMLEALDYQTFSFTWSYDSDRNVFIVCDDGNITEYSAIKRDGMTLWSIGAYEWVWDIL